MLQCRWPTQTYIQEEMLPKHTRNPAMFSKSRPWSERLRWKGSSRAWVLMMVSGCSWSWEAPHALRLLLALLVPVLACHFYCLQKALRRIAKHWEADPFLARWLPRSMAQQERLMSLQMFCSLVPRMKNSAGLIAGCCSPHHCVGFLFLALHPASAVSFSSSPPPPPPPLRCFLLTSFTTHLTQFLSHKPTHSHHLTQLPPNSTHSLTSLTIHLTKLHSHNFSHTTHLSLIISLNFHQTQLTPPISFNSSHTTSSRTTSSHDLTHTTHFFTNGEWKS